MTDRAGAGREVPILWNGRRVRAFVPDRLAERDLRLDAPSAARAAAAAVEVAHAAEALDVRYEPLARLLLRSEGVASSFIEGVSAPVVDVVLAEEGLGSTPEGPAGWIAANLATVAEAIRETVGRPLTIETLCEWHRTLMSGAPTAGHQVGRVREAQGWIGGTSPLDAHLVTPPPGELEGLLEDLVAYANRDDVDPVAQAAIVHAQFELIHPFGDGNGRVGRVLIAEVLTRRLSLVVPPPVSVAIAADVGGYASGLTLFRLGDHLTWIRWFADAVARGGRLQRQLVADVETLGRTWRERLAAEVPPPRADAAVHAALDLLPTHLVLTSATLVEGLGISRRVAIETLHRLVRAGILVELGRLRTGRAGQPAELYASGELAALAAVHRVR